MKVAPTVAAFTAGFPNQDHHIDTITGKPERLGLNALVESITENAASIATLKGGGLFPHTALCMSPAEDATIQHSLPIVLALPPRELTFTPGDTAVVGREDTKLLYYKHVYDFELESHLATALKNITMAKLDESAYI